MVASVDVCDGCCGGLAAIAMASLAASTRAAAVAIKICCALGLASGPALIAVEMSDER